MPRKPVILDTDAGVDDAMAIILALRSPELDVQAITTVAGNVSEPPSPREACMARMGWVSWGMRTTLNSPRA